MEAEIEVDYDEYVSPEHLVPPKDDLIEDELDDVYGDLFDDSGEKATLLKAKHAALEDHSKSQAQEIQQLKEQLAACMAEKDNLVEEKRILVRNISCVFRTAQEEIQRKNEALKEKDAIIDQRTIYATQTSLVGAQETPPKHQVAKTS